MKLKFILKKNFNIIRILLIIIGTLILFRGYYFIDKPVTIDTIIINKKSPEMYICLVFSFCICLLINYIIGGFNKKNVEKMKSMKEFEE
jgi:hypothetical protein